MQIFLVILKKSCVLRFAALSILGRITQICKLKVSLLSRKQKVLKNDRCEIKKLVISTKSDTVIIQFSYTSTEINRIRLIRRVFARNERIRFEKVSLCPTKRDINR